MKIKKIVVTTNSQGICYCTSGKKTKKIALSVEGGTKDVKYCQYCGTAYLRQDSYEPTLFKRYKVLNNVETNEEMIRSMREKANLLVRIRKEASKERQITLMQIEKVIHEKEVAKTKEMEEHKKYHEGRVEIYSHDMDKHYTEPFVPKNPKEHKKRSFFS